MTSSKKQPKDFFRSFLEAIKPTIEAFCPHPAKVWSVPYEHLTGLKYGTLYKLRARPTIPVAVFQNASNLLALQEIAFLDTDSATLEDARRIARQRLADILSDVPPPPERKQRPKLVCLDTRKFRRTTDDDAWRAASLRAQGLMTDEIADEIGCSQRTVQRLLRSVLGQYKPCRVGRPPAGHEKTQREIA